MKSILFFGFQSLLCLLTLSSCYTPVNLNFESSEMLNKGEIELQACGSGYKASEEIFSNMGFKIGAGIGDKFNLKLRYEYQRQLSSSTFDLSELNYNIETHFTELDFKFGTASDRVSFSTPIGYYNVQDLHLIQFDPRLYYSFVKNDRFDLTFIPKCHLAYTSQILSVNPGISLGSGIHSKSKKFTFRAEVGIDRSSLSGGLALSYKIGRTGNQKTQPDVEH
jgi:hypothetical protein